jgi:hypothetical protein
MDGGGGREVQSIKSLRLFSRNVVFFCFHFTVCIIHSTTYIYFAFYTWSAVYGLQSADYTDR